jgi:hypothetical protein
VKSRAVDANLRRMKLQYAVARAEFRRQEQEAAEMREAAWQMYLRCVTQIAVLNLRMAKIKAGYEQFNPVFTFGDSDDTT